MAEDSFVEKSQFEEIEDKLEEMFAGIEDEQLLNTTTDDKNMPKKVNDSLDNYLKVNCNDTTIADNKELLIERGLKSDPSTSNKSSVPTKAAQKSTTALGSTETTKQLNLLFRDYKNTSIPKSMVYLKTIPPRRRLSIGINKELLNLSLKTSDNIKISNNDIKFNIKSHGDVKQIKIKNPKNKISHFNQGKCSKYKKETADIKSNISGSKKKSRKPEAPIKEKQNQQKIKQAQIHRVFSSENDTEERPLQTRDIECKTRSPFILLKNNGSVTVVNTMAPDESNEKFTRSKKNSNVFERKTFKGCYSSTLGNRYDADTADSSWKCVFCKIGPHKKNLGDLFGPYIISSDCDEYRSTKDYFENFQKFRRNGVHLLNFSHKSLSFVNETPNFHIRNISKSNCEHLINIYTSGMSQVSIDCYEIWLHEECAIWAPNIFVVGSRLAGLEEATWISTRYECVHCLKQGALLCCLQRDCKTTSHVPCAREFNWLLDESKFWVYCSKHAFRNKN